MAIVNNYRAYAAIAPGVIERQILEEKIAAEREQAALRKRANWEENEYRRLRAEILGEEAAKPAPAPALVPKQTMPRVVNIRGASKRSNIVKHHVKKGYAYCSRCKQVKPESEFVRHKGHINGLQSWCRDCTRKHFNYTGNPAVRFDHSSLPEGLAYCSHCKQVKKKDEFSRCASKPSGVQNWCKACLAEYKVRSAGRPATKTCRRCGRELPGSEFYKSTQTASHLHTWCKDCCRANALRIHNERKQKRS